MAARDSNDAVRHKREAAAQAEHSREIARVERLMPRARARCMEEAAALTAESRQREEAVAARERQAAGRTKKSRQVSRAEERRRPPRESRRRAAGWEALALRCAMLFIAH